MSTQKFLKNFEQIYKETYDTTLKFIICKCNSFDDVDDIIQETYLELYKVLKDKKEILDKQAYIITIAKNKLIKYSKSNEKINTISIYQEYNDEEFTIDLDSRN